MKTRPNNPAQLKKTQLLLDAASKRFRQSFAQGRFDAALQACMQAAQLAPTLATPWIDAAVSCIKLERWDSAIAHAQQALQRGGSSFALFDALAHAHAASHQAEASLRYGQQALQLRAQSFAQAPALAHTPPASQPAAPSAANRSHNLIAFSLFGANVKYCEAAVLNARAQPLCYPHWTCRFYIDDSVPPDVVQRLRELDCEVLHIDANLARWPGPMWRFAAYDSPGLQRVIFRDADSVISEREARAVQQWIDSPQRFHHMRDFGSHTELLLAGLWGCVAGALPPMHSLVDIFLRKPVQSQHFADQYFLREYVWPYARDSLLQHDSVFNFMDPLPFPDDPDGPDGPAPSRFHVGCAECAPQFEVASSLPEGSLVRWTIYRPAEAAPNQAESTICSYDGVVRNGAVRDHLPSDYARQLQSGSLQIRVQARTNV